MTKETIRTKWQSFLLQRKMDKGKAPHGRTEGFVPLKRSIRERWLEFCLRLRMTKEAGKALFGFGGNTFPVGRLYAKKINSDGKVEDIGLISTKVVTTAGVNYIVDAFQNLVEPENMKYHASGTGTTAEATTDTALVTEVESRVAGTQTEGASANVYRTVGTITYTAARAITEHGIFSASTAGTLLDRSVFTAINVSANDKIEFTYDLTVNAGG